MDVSVIIVNYNTREFTVQCIESIFKHTDGISFEVIVVDNASNDDSCNFLRQVNGVKVIEAEINLGFGRANNLGVKFAKGKYIFLLNSDTKLKNNAIKYFFDFYERNGIKLNIGALGSFLEDDRGSVNHSYDSFPSVSTEFRQYIYKVKKKLFREHNHNKPILKVDYIMGSDLFMEKKIFDELNGFDEDFFMYYEETDLQMRMSKLMYNRLIIDTPKIIHYEGGSFGEIKSLTFNRFKYSYVSMVKYMVKHYSQYYVFIYRIVFFTPRIVLFFRSCYTKQEKLSMFRLMVLSSIKEISHE